MAPLDPSISSLWPGDRPPPNPGCQERLSSCENLLSRRFFQNYIRFLSTPARQRGLFCLTWLRNVLETGVIWPGFRCGFPPRQHTPSVWKCWLLPLGHPHPLPVSGPRSGGPPSQSGGCSPKKSDTESMPTGSLTVHTQGLPPHRSPLFPQFSEFANLLVMHQSLKSKNAQKLRRAHALLLEERPSLPAAPPMPVTSPLLPGQTSLLPHMQTLAEGVQRQL